MADEVKPLTTTESRPMVRHRAACSCKWHGEWYDNIEPAKKDRDRHMKEHN